MKSEIKSEDESKDKLCEESDDEQCKRRFISRFISSEDFELIKGLGIASLLSVIFVIGGFFLMVFTFFYGSPEIVIWSVFLLLLRIRVCNGRIDISLQGILHKYLKIDITFI